MYKTKYKVSPSCSISGFSLAPGKGMKPLFYRFKKHVKDLIGKDGFEGEKNAFGHRYDDYKDKYENSNPKELSKTEVEDMELELFK